MENETLETPLEVIEEIIIERPELTQEQWEVVAKAEPWVRATLKPEIMKELDAKYEIRAAKFEELQRVEMQKAVNASMEDWKKSQEPLSNEDLTKLLNQEYLEFSFEFKVGKERHSRHFTICEMPQEAEKKFIKVADEHFMPLLELMTAADFSQKFDGSIADQIKAIISQIPYAIDVASELCAICLDPWGEDTSMNKHWVQKNLSTARIWSVLNCQSEANRYRDFFSNGSLLSRSLRKR